MNPIEQRIAEVMQSLALSGDIIDTDAAALVVQQCHIKGLTIDDVMQGRTPKAIVQRWMHRRMSLSAEQPDTAVDMPQYDGRRYPLLPFSKVVHDDLCDSVTGPAQGATDCSSRWSFPIMLRAHCSQVDAERLTQAVEHVLRHHPVFSMHIEQDDTHWYDHSYRSPYIDIQVRSEADYVYLSITLNRILGDATSFVLLAQNLWRAYRGESLPHDGYLSYLQLYQRMTLSDEYAQHAQWLMQHYDNPTCPLLPRQDSPQGLLPQTAPSPVIVQPDYADALAALSRKEHISTNAFYCLSVALAIMEYNGTDEAGLTWAYQGRESREQMHIFGSLHRDIPLLLTRKGAAKSSNSLHHLFAQLRNQMEQGILHSDYPFTLLSPKDSPWHTAVNVLVQPGMADAFDSCPANFQVLPTDQPTESYCMLDINITQAPLTLTIDYSPRHYTEASIQRFANLIDQQARTIIHNS